MNNNDFLKFKKENEKEDSLIINEDLFEQDDLDSDDDQIILNEDRDGECSFFSNNSENELKKFKIISSNINIKDNINRDDNNENIKQENNIVNKEMINNNNILNKEKKEEIKDVVNNKMNINDNKKEIKIKEEKILKKENKEKIEEKIQINNNIKENNQQTKLNSGLQKKSNSKNYFSKKVLYHKNKENKENKEIKENKENKENKLSKEKINTKNNFTEKKENENIKREILTEKRQKSKKSYINKMKEKKNMKINYNNHDKIWKNSSRNEEGSKSYLEKGKNDILPGTEISFDKYGNKTVMKKRDKNDLLNKISKTNQKIIKIEQKLNKSYDNNTNTKSNINNINNTSRSKNKYLSNPSSPKINNKKINKINVNKSSEVMVRNTSKKSFQDTNKINETNAESLKKVLMNKINNQINQIIKGKENMYFNDNNNLFFLGFCDILFELGFLHIKETEINDIAQIKNNLNQLYTQPFTNRKLLSENFLFNEQKLLICAWKTILNNFILIKEFDSLPQELEEITLDDCKLFIYIITGLFIGFNQKNLNEENKIKTEIKQMKNKSLSNFRKKNSNKDLINEVKMNQSYTKSFNNKNNKYHFRKKSENRNHKDSHNESNNSNGSSNENILKNILDNRKQSDYNYKSILKIKNFFTYFSELRKLYNLYKKELKKINKKKSTEKELTFHPKTNKNNRILLDKFSPKMDFFQRNALIKKRNEKKIIVLQRERSQKMLKECTFEPCKSNKKIEKIEHLNPKEISERLYHSKNNSNKLQKSENLNLKINSDPRCRRGSKIFSDKKSKEKFHFKPNINKNFNREMFANSPLDKDELLNKRIKDIRDANLNRLINNYEKNIRGVLTEEMKKDKNLLLQEIIMEENRNMKLGNEKRTNKDTFDNYQNFNFYNMPNYNYFFNENEINEPLFTVEIKIKQNIKSIEVYQDDIPEKLAYDFCLENSLGKGSYEKIVNIIKAKLNEIQNGNFNEDIIENNKEESNREETNKVNKEKIHEIINQNEQEINENKDKEIIDSNINLNDNEINIIKDEEQNKKELNEQNDKNNMKDEYIVNIDEQHDLSTEEIKQEIKEEEIKQDNDLEEEKKNIIDV